MDPAQIISCMNQADEGEIRTTSSSHFMAPFPTHLVKDFRTYNCADTKGSMGDKECRQGSEKLGR